ncbi:MAG: YigZ family protein [Acidobacteria bacterium]|nr:YigZ family protein [Acidobacteriota bacterium]
MRRPTHPSTWRIREKASVFLAELWPAVDSESRRILLQQIRKRDHGATHHCSAWREGFPALASGMDDDGEPSGTAGRPMLRVLEGADLTDCLAVCVRWFGGTKLGTGGLQRAYTEALQGALQAAEAQGFLETLRLLRRGHLQAPGDQSHLPFALLSLFPEARAEAPEFGPEGVSVGFSVPAEAAQALEAAWRERSRGGRVLWE